MCGNTPSSQPIMNTASYSRPLALWRVISVHRLSSVRSASWSVYREIWARNSSSGRDVALALELAVGVELAGDADQLLEVLDPPLGLDRPLRLERVEVAALGEDRLEQLGDGAGAVGGLGALAQAAHRLGEPAHRLQRRGAQAGHPLGLGEHVPDVLAGGVRVREQPRLGRLADPAARRVDDPRERHRVGRVRDQAQVGDRVLDLGALVELRAPDHLVGDLEPHQRVLEHAALGVDPVEDRDLVARRSPRRVASRSISEAT